MTLEQLQAFFGEGFTVTGGDTSTDGEYYTVAIRNNATGEEIGISPFTENRLEVYKDFVVTR